MIRKSKTHSRWPGSAPLLALLLTLSSASASFARPLAPGVEGSALAEALAQPDPGSRVAAIESQSAVPPHSATERQELARLLEGAAREDAAGAVRRAAIEALATLAEEGARALGRLALDLGPEEASLASLHLSSSRAGRAVAYELLTEVFADAGRLEDTPPAVLALWFEGYGRTFAEREADAERAAARVPFVLGDLHPSPLVRAEARRSLDLALRRLRELERHDQADRLLDRLASDGLPAREVQFLRTRAQLAEGGVDPAVALLGARALRRVRGGPDAWADLRWAARARYVEGLAWLAADDPGQAAESLRAADGRLEGLLARRTDLVGAKGAEDQRDILHELALCRIARALVRLAEGAAGDDLAVLEALRRAHELELEAQRVAVEGDAQPLYSLDGLFDGALGPMRWLFAERPHPAWPPERCIELEERLARGLASVAPRELPGVEPYPDLPPELSDPVEDPRRRELLGALGRAELRALERRYNELRDALLEATRREEDIEVEADFLRLRMFQLERELKERTLEERYYELRLPAREALRLSDLLRREGRDAEARAYAQRVADVVAAAGLPARYPWAVRLEARARLAVGGAWTDEGRPEEAEQAMLAGLALLEGLQTHYLENGAPGAAREVELEISDALVSLAVNANVKAGDAERALEYFERAYEVQQDDSMRALLACYRARSGRAEEARELIREVPASPRVYYNLACTHALLGESEQALELLERDFEEARTSAASLEKQKAWAREDPDLESLRGDPRFEELTAAAEE